MSNIIFRDSRWIPFLVPGQETNFPISYRIEGKKQFQKALQINRSAGMSHILFKIRNNTYNTTLIEENMSGQFCHAKCQPVVRTIQ